MPMKLRSKLLAWTHRKVGLGRPSYSYRSSPSINAGPDAWFVSGYDKYNEKRGILEWCHNQQDAEDIFQQMLKYSNQFTNLDRGSYQKIDWVRTTWDTHY